MKGVYKFHWSCGRMGNLDGVFVADTGDVEAIQGKEVYFGEVLGKHSEISGAIDPGDITLVSSDPSVVEIIEDYGLSSGFNPFDYYEPPENDEEDA